MNIEDLYYSLPREDLLKCVNDGINKQGHETAFIDICGFYTEIF